MTFKDKLRLLLENKGITQKKLAEDLHIAPSTMGGYARGASEPDFEMLKRIANYFSVSTDYLLDFSKYSNPNTPKGKVDIMDDELLRNFHMMNMEQRVIYIDQGKAIVNYNKRRKEQKKGEDQ